jgi:hypothetical protein
MPVSDLEPEPKLSNGSGSSRKFRLLAAPAHNAEYKGICEKIANFFLVIK